MLVRYSILTASIIPIRMTRANTHKKIVLCKELPTIVAFVFCTTRVDIIKACISRGLYCTCLSVQHLLLALAAAWGRSRLQLAAALRVGRMVEAVSASVLQCWDMNDCVGLWTEDEQCAWAAGCVMDNWRVGEHFFRKMYRYVACDAF